MDVIAEEWAGRFSAYGDSTLAMLAVIWIRSRLVPRSPTLRPIRKAGTVSEIAVHGRVSRLRRWFGYFVTSAVISDRQSPAIGSGIAAWQVRNGLMTCRAVWWTRVPHEDPAPSDARRAA